jgi:glycosyltransferase involved in cell wall biosynthesis
MTKNNPSQKITVLHLMHTYLPEVNGVALNTYAILKELSRTDDIDSIVFAPASKRSGEIRNFDVPHKVIRYFAPPFKRFSVAVTILAQLLRTYLREKFDVLQCHGPDQIHIGGLFKRIVPSVVTVGMFRNDRMFKGSSAKIRRLRSGLKRMDRIVSISPVITGLLTAYDRGLRDRIVDLPLGIDLDHYRSVPAGQAGYPYILYLGRLTGGKRVDVLLNAFARVRRDMPDLFLHILGDGPQREELTALSGQLGTGEHVRFFGMVTGDEKIAMLKGAELVGFPSGSGEGFPGVLLEALACSRIVVANDYETARVVIRDGETGFIYARDNPDEMARLIMHVRKNREMLETKMLPSINEEVEKYDIKKIAAQYRALYKDIAIPRPAAGR